MWTTGNLEWNEMLTILLEITRNKIGPYGSTEEDMEVKLQKKKKKKKNLHSTMERRLWSLTSLYPLGASQFLSLCGTKASSYWNKAILFSNSDFLLMLQLYLQNEWTLGLDFKTHKQYF